MPFLRCLLTPLALFWPLFTASAQQEFNLLDVTSRVTPSIAFTQKYVETIVNDPDFGPSVNPTDTFTLKIVSTLQGVDLTAIDEATAVGFTCGTFSDSHSLGDDPAYRAGNTSATFVIPGPPVDPNDPDSDLTVAATITYSWSATALTITATGSLIDAGLIVDPTQYDDGPIADTTTATVTFSDGSGSHDVNLTGTHSTTHKTVGTGDDAQEFDLASATITGAGNYFGPKVTLAPIPATTTSSSLPITITSPAAVNVNVSLNNGDFLPLTADPQTGLWQTTLTLQPGANHVEVRADDGGDGLSAAGGDTFYTVQTRLTITTSGSGSVTAALTGATQHPIGQMLTAVATPAAGQIFTGWSGDLASTSPTLTFAVTANMQLTANFAPSPFVAVSGTYTASFTGTPAGALTLLLTSGGAYTGQIRIGGRTYAVLGRFLADGTSEAVAKTDVYHQNLLLDLTFDTTGSNTLTGTLGYNDGSDPSTFTASASGGHPTGVRAGAWTFVLNSSAADFPSIGGYATMSVSATGLAQIVGRVSDGISLQPFSGSGQIGSDNLLHFYAALYPRNRVRFGALSGDVQFGASCTGQLTLHVETVAVSRVNGATSTVVVDNPLTLAGSPYIPAKRGPATLNLASDLSDFTLTKTLALTVNGVARVTNPARDATTLTVVYRTGYFAGTFVQTALGLRIGYSGVILSGSAAPGGIYLHLRYNAAEQAYDGDYGAVTLTQAP